MQNKILIGGAVAVVLYLVATRTCVGKKLVARALGRELADCGCSDCGSHGAAPSTQTEPAASLVSTSVMLNLGGKDSGCDDCGGSSSLTGQQPTASLPVNLGVRRAAGERVEFRPQPAPLPVKEPPPQRESFELLSRVARTTPPIPVPVPEQKSLSLIGGNVAGAGKGGR